MLILFIVRKVLLPHQMSTFITMIRLLILKGVAVQKDVRMIDLDGLMDGIEDHHRTLLLFLVTIGLQNRKNLPE